EARSRDVASLSEWYRPRYVLSDRVVRNILQGETAPLLTDVRSRPRRLEVTLRRRHALVDEPARLSPGDTEPLDRISVERRALESDARDRHGYPMAPCICS